MRLAGRKRGMLSFNRAALAARDPARPMRLGSAVARRAGSVSGTAAELTRQLGQRRRGVGDAGGDRVRGGLAQPDRPQQRQQVLVRPGTRARPGRHLDTPPLSGSPDQFHGTAANHRISALLPNARQATAPGQAAAEGTATNAERDQGMVAAIRVTASVRISGLVAKLRRT
ncbi:hypothetical protein Ade02nite_47370 [Paractinoplanes deccanensis]|uniref:Uncharacterized protein n=1 Tax=Paractinoplanes deccanensis TaxID=113561 RepID=A0ABQ3Y7Z1_9ACTN|nr:hypothetical protein Ade02nite_47370 [Actinoplanes deccanensis]